MSILRIGLLVAVVIAVLPEDEKQQARLYDGAASAVRWTATFCDRNGPTCTKAGELWTAFAAKARFGAQMAYALAIKYSKGDGGAVVPATFAPSDGTLKPEDLKPDWRGSAGNDGV